MHLPVGRELHFVALPIDTPHGAGVDRRLPAGLKSELASETDRTSQTIRHANHTITAAAHTHRHKIGARHPDRARPTADLHQPHVTPCVALDPPPTAPAAQPRPDLAQCRVRPRCGRDSATTAPRKDGQRRDRPETCNNQPTRDS